ncbi:CPBP family intramembrane glutamic endopeptidase [Loigolactobacillus jiayinensis]|uniref:CPBP family intramembrane glutamic endopeptidase n=1 Tax=Loigolactobacillus jiayinensis TaxID=2486016 RepID=A0ABW1RC38_9LACO|nr:type II CAAX endopeptidase family protein [Loigolactobacillus jiayinensis]
MIRKISANLAIGAGLFLLPFVIQFNGIGVVVSTANGWIILPLVLIFAGLIWLLLKISRQLSFELLAAPFTGRMVLGAILIAVLLTTIALGLDYLWPSSHSNNQYLSQQFLSPDHLHFWITVVTVNLTSPVLEEVVFRGLILQFIQKISHSAVAGLVIAAVFFAYSHNGDPLDPVYLIDGLGLGYLFLRTQNIGATIICHQVMNLLATLQLFM